VGSVKPALTVLTLAKRLAEHLPPWAPESL